MANNQETAFEIYKNGYKDKFYSKEAPQSKLFFVKLRKAVINELETTGFCELVDYILETNCSRRGTVDIVVYSVFADIFSGYEKNVLTDVENDSKYCDFIPYITSGRSPSGLISWSDCGRIGAHYIPLNDRATETIRKARHLVRMRHVESVPNNEKDLNKDEAVPIINAQEEAMQIIGEAKSEAARILSETRVEVERISESAQISANTIITDANKKAEEKAQESASRLIERYLTSEQKRFKKELNDDLSRHTAELLDNSKRAATTHTEMCNATNAIQAKWIQTLDEALSQMSAVKAEFYSHIHDWQVSLFPSEIKPLAERYLELYRIINVDKLLREAILFKNTTEVECDQAENIDEIENITTANEECPDTVIAGLQKLNKTLTIFLRRFETALNGLDLYVFYPNEGDEFDDMWHIPDDEDVEYYGKRIKECVIPGIAKKANDDCGDDVLIPAVVKVEMES